MALSRRALFSLLNTALLGASLVVMFLFPQYAAFALYAVVGWIAAGLTLTWSGWASHGSGASAPAGAPASGASPLAGGAAGVPSGAPIDFCLYCGSYFAPGERSCSSCGKPLPRPMGAV